MDTLWHLLFLLEALSQGLVENIMWISCHLLHSAWGQVNVGFGVAGREQLVCPARGRVALQEELLSLLTPLGLCRLLTRDCQLIIFFRRSSGLSRM